MSSKSLAMEMAREGEGRYETAIATCLAEIDRILKRIRRQDTQIERSQRRTRALLADLKARK